MKLRSGFELVTNTKERMLQQLTPQDPILSPGTNNRNRQHLIMVPGIQQSGHSEDNSNEIHVTEDTSMNDDVITISKVEVMKGIINSVSNLRDQAQLPQAPDLEQAFSLGCQRDSDKNPQTKGDVVLLYFVYILCIALGGC